MPTIQNRYQPVYADGTGGPIAGTGEYTLHYWINGWYRNMFTAFGIGLSTASPILEFRDTNLWFYSGNPGSRYAAAINETDEFRAMTWGFDLNMLGAEFREGLLGSALEALGWQNNQEPVAVCQDLTLEADEMCLALGSIDGGSYDPDGEADVVSVSIDPAAPYALGETLATLTIVDAADASAFCQAVVTVEDVTPPVITCNVPETMTPPQAPITFDATTQDNCGATATVIDYTCWAINGAGKVIDKTESCVVSIDGSTLTVVDSGGVGDNIEWTVLAEDSSGNMTEQTCSIVVTNPGNGQGKGKGKSKK
jgi:hypothetical protein